MHIGDLSRRTGVSQRLLRYYEEQGLLAPRRGPGGYREYDDGDVDTVRAIRTLLAAGLGTRTIAELLPCTVDDEEGLPVPACSGLLPDLHRERERIDRAVADLLSARTALNALIAATPGAAGASAPNGTPATPGALPDGDAVCLA
ncbi:MerR family transcriptional regulator [Streptomyces sp. NPDC047315]|uniref:MerR family transcriptional regulator n=1 Tax=Streptomyces sp. NPDC047315 TaxID=3155142 RepID=UPI0033D1E093